MLCTVNNNTLPAQAKQGVVLLDFYAEWCGPCAALAPTVERLAEDFTVCKCDIDQNSDLAARYGIMSVPTLVILLNGQERERMIGTQTEHALRARLEAAT